MSLMNILGNVPREYFEYVGNHDKPIQPDEIYTKIRIPPNDKKEKVFTKEGERWAFKTYNWLRYQLNDLRTNVLNGNEEEAHNFFRRKVGEVDEAIKQIINLEEQICQANLPFLSRAINMRRPRKVINFLLSAGHDTADLLAEGAFALFKSLRVHDVNSGNMFITHMYTSVSHRINHLLRKATTIMRTAPGRRIKDFEDNKGERVINSAIEHSDYLKNKGGIIGIAEEAERNLQIEKIYRAIKCLSTTQKETFCLYYGIDTPEMSIVEIARRDRVSHCAIRGRIDRAQERIHKNLAS